MKEKSDNRPSNNEGLALLVTPPEKEPKYITPSRQVVQKALSETSVLFSTQAAGVIPVVPHHNIAQSHASRMA